MEGIIDFLFSVVEQFLDPADTITSFFLNFMDLESIRLMASLLVDACSIVSIIGIVHSEYLTKNGIYESFSVTINRTLNQTQKIPKWQFYALITLFSYMVIAFGILPNTGLQYSYFWLAFIYSKLVSYIGVFLLGILYAKNPKLYTLVILISVFVSTFITYIVGQTFLISAFIVIVSTIEVSKTLKSAFRNYIFSNVFIVGFSLACLAGGSIGSQLLWGEQSIPTYPFDPLFCFSFLLGIAVSVVKKYRYLLIKTSQTNLNESYITFPPSSNIYLDDFVNMPSLYTPPPSYVPMSDRISFFLSRNKKIIFILLAVVFLIEMFVCCLTGRISINITN